MKAYLYVIKRALADGKRVAIWDCEGYDWITKRVGPASPRAYQTLKDGIEAIEWSNIEVWDVDPDGHCGDPIATFAVMLEYGQPPEETICDYVCSEYAERVMADYDAGHRL